MTLLIAILSSLKSFMVQQVLRLRVQARYPSLRSHHTVIWDYSFDGLDSLQLGQDVSIAPFAEILVYRHTKHSPIEGKLVVGDRVFLGTGVNIRAAGGSIIIGNQCGIGQHTVFTAANHSVQANANFIHTPWNVSKTGITLGNNVWVGANCVLLPGVSIGDNSVVGAGSVVTKSIPPNEIWVGVPARKLRDIT